MNVLRFFFAQIKKRILTSGMFIEKTDIIIDNL